MAERSAEIHEELQEVAEKSEGKKWVAVYIAVLAVMLAITNMGASNSMKDMLSNNIYASNYWAFFQAKTIRQTTLRVAADDLSVLAARLEEYAELGFERVYCHQVGRDQAAFIDAFGEHVLPRVAAA